YRLNVMPIRTPPLRERVDDIPRLAHYFLLRAAEGVNGKVATVAPETIELLQRYAWPGNVRELANAIERAVILCRNGVLVPSHFTGHLHMDADARDPDGTAIRASGSAFNLDEIERRTIGQALVATHGNRTRAAKLLGISERTLRNKLNTPKSEH